MIQQLPFTKQGINIMIDEISKDYDNDTKTLVIIVNGIQITVPFCADNVNAIDYLLKEMYISEHTGVETTGNNRVAYDRLNAKFEQIREVANP